MASEILAVPEEDLEDVIRVIRAGIASQEGFVDPDVIAQLRKWCDDEAAYLANCEADVLYCDGLAGTDE